MLELTARLLRSTLLAAALALAARAAGNGEEPPQKAQRGSQAKKPPAAEPLSEEDAALVRELALLERVDLLRNLELFEPEKQPQVRRKQGAP